MNKKGFTLIELLAVIIILGILLLIAIPSVTKYIEDSRKESYVTTIKEIIKASTTLVNSGDIEVYDTNTTYYIPASAIDLESGDAQSPYGKLTDAYVVVTYDGDNYDYYYVGKDEENIGIEKVISDENLNKNEIKTNIGDINTDTSIWGKDYVVVFGDDLTPSEPKLASIKTKGNGTNNKKECPQHYTSRIYWALQDNDGDGKNEKLVISDKSVSGSLSGNFLGSEENMGFSGIPWINVSGSSNPNHRSYYVDTIVVEGNVVPKSIAGWFFDIGQGVSSLSADLDGLNVCKVIDMRDAFSYMGKNATTWDIGDLSVGDTSNVKDMTDMFSGSGPNARVWYVGDLSNWDTSNVTSMQGMFHYAASDSSSWNVGDIGKWDTSKVTNMSYMFQNVASNSSSWYVGDIGKWNTSNVTRMDWMFAMSGKNISNWTVGDLSNWDTSKVTSMHSMFYSSGLIDSIRNVGDISHWNTSNVTDMGSLFEYAAYRLASFKIDISGWNTSKVTNMTRMFDDAGSYVSTWSVKIPKTNGNGISNDPRNLYGSSTSVYVQSPSSTRTFTVAS